MPLREADARSASDALLNSAYRGKQLALWDKELRDREDAAAREKAEQKRLLAERRKSYGQQQRRQTRSVTATERWLPLSEASTGLRGWWRCSRSREVR